MDERRIKMERPKETIDIENFKVATKELPDKLKIYVKVDNTIVAISEVAKILSKNREEDPCILLLLQ